MPTAQFIQEGDALDYTPVADTPAGSVIVLGGLIGITKQDLAANERGAIAVTGVFDVAKTTGADTGATAGSSIYWHVGDQEAKTQSVGGVLMGKSVLDASDADTTFRIRLSQ